MKLCEVITRSCHLCGEMLPVYKDLVMSALACGVKDTDELIRASSMSGIGDLCYLLHHSIGSLIEEVRLVAVNLFSISKYHGALIALFIDYVINKA